ncbi:retrovirus-related pol polyprotein from transposon TNT 1-94 [Tanacetum coccineum]
MMIRGGKIQKANKKSLNAKGNNKVKGKGKDKKVYIPKPKNPKPTAMERLAKDDVCHHCKEVGHWKRNCPVYLAELLKKKKPVGSASSSDPESKRWVDAMNAEMQSMIDNMVWVLVDLPPNSRLVAKGYTQTYMVDYEETFIPVADIRAIRILISITAFYDYEIWQMDVKTAFLNGYLDEDIYMVQPEGFVDPKHPRKVCKLQRSIYGLKQALRSWNKRFDEEIKKFGFDKNLDEPCVYQKASGSNVTFLILYVDDVTPSNLSMQRNVEYPRALLYGSIAQDMRTTTKRVQFEKLVNVSRAKKLEKSHDPLALVAHTGSSSRNTLSYYVTHPMSVVDYEEEYQQDDVHTNSEDPLTSAMLNQAIIQGDKVNIQSRNSDNAGRNNRRAYVQEEIVEGSNAPNETRNIQRTLRTSSSGNTSTVQCYNCSGKGDYARNCPKPRVRDSKYFMEQMLLAKQDEAGVILTDEQNDFLFADASRMEEIKELSANICLMARIQPADNTSDVGPSYESAFIMCGSIEKDTHVLDLCALEQLARNAYQEAEKQQIFAQKVQKQNMTLTSQLELYKERVQKTTDKLDLDVKDYKRQNEELQKTHSILKRQISENEDKYHDTVLDLEAKLKKNVDLILKLGNSLQGMFMLGPKPLSVYDQQLKHGNSEISLNVRDTEDTLDDASKSQQKVYEKMNDPIAVANKQNCWTIDYAQINALYKDFVPQKELSAEQKYFPSSFIPFDKNSNATPSIPASMPKNQNLLFTISELKTRLENVKKGMNAASSVRRQMNKDLHVKNSVLANSKKPAKKVAVYVRKNKQTDITSGNHKLNVRSNARRTFSVNSRIPKSSETTFVAPKTRFSEKATQSKTLDTTSVASKSKIDEASASKVRDKVVQIVLWVVDSGCSKHMTGDRALLRNFIEKFMGTVRFGNDNFAAITGYGDYIHGNITICHVYYVEGDDLLTGGRDSNLYTISISDMAASSPICLMSKATSTKSWLWHRRLSHLNFGTINDLTKLDLVDGLPKFKYGKDHLCSACERGKSKKASHPPKLIPSDYSKLELLHMDLCGPMRVASVNGKKYILVIVDDFSRFTWVYFLRSKDETPEIIKKFIAQAQLNYKAKVCKIRTDNGTEFKNATLKAYYEKLGIMQQFSIARTPQQNGVVERRNRTLVEAARTMLIFSRLPEFLWAEAVATACFTQNRSIINTRHNKTPYELLRGRKPNVEYFHVFGSLCYLTNDRVDIGLMSLPAIASEHDCLEPELQRFNNQNSSDDLMNTPSKEDLDNLFGPMFEDYFEQKSSDTTINSAAQLTHDQEDSPSTSLIIV